MSHVSVYQSLYDSGADVPNLAATGKRPITQQCAVMHDSKSPLSLREAQRIKIDKYMKQLLERDFSCVICLDILIKPLQLNCSHSFCRRCIHKWKIRQNLCPICREAITAETENDSLEYFISSVAELLGEDFMKEREEALNDRKTVEESDNNERPYEELFLDVVADFGAVMSHFYEDPDDIDITESAAPYYLVISSSDSDD
ncbi:hypothetical protein TNCV_3286121 [Trichonephila clavipes]|nr:hypothetical protein TNCV_3286121 [Trichonephila clavipes]